MQNHLKLHFWVGLFVCFGLSALLILTFKLSNNNAFSTEPQITLHANFDNIGSLKVRAPVKIGGVVVGEVTSINIDPKTFIPEVSFTIEKKMHLPNSSSASILTSGLLGAQYLAITPGFSDENTEILKNGAYIEDTKSALILEDLIGKILYNINSK
ncbi:outer membrane lipid asymmetry maintenance protein MlaD [Paraphotobacterium marinum]|uniref:Outer membrane lipid asymmetry maintenance protein MlaD n=1 Tax=Paraphotobacterium marinum TaxID=1755811 RepID=A0A220VCJ3_9GAMM|nr:outer membrane lipid asymmetry maintenance protein MlaD [Paraphotobacterium marinum]ASK77946.1 outer membrane lipid asymmetry maintenance protein MlaD [Paraphotobacterium marinum]